MKPAPFEYVVPHSLPEALEILAEHGDEAKVLAGGQSLIPVMNFRLAQPTLIVDINELQELAYIEPAAADGLRIGAMTRQSRLERDPLVAEHAPLLHEAIPHIAHPQIRNRGTLGGSLAHADPAAELPVLAVALDGRLRLQSQSGDRWVEARDFFVGLFETALEPQELLVEIALPPRRPRTGYAFVELARRHGDYALAGVAAWVRLDETGRCKGARLVYLNADGKPLVADQAAGRLQGQSLADDVIDDAIADAAETAAHTEIDPAGDIHASAAYKRHLAQVLTKRALKIAYQRAQQTLEL